MTETAASAATPPPPADRSASANPRPAPPSPRPAQPPRRGGAMAGLALVLALLALAGVAFGGWQWWHGRQQRQADDISRAQLQKQVNTLRQAWARAKQDDAARTQARQALQAANQAAQQRLASLFARVDSLDTAVATLAQHRRDGREAALLDQAEMLLRMGQQRYTLFHDAEGALHALDQAAQVLSATHDSAVTGVREHLRAERQALAAMHPASRAADLAALAALRAQIVNLPLRPLDHASATPAPSGFGARIWHALSTAVVIRRTDDSIQNVADARLARQLAALDVAQAQAARLAWNAKASHAALTRVAQALDTAFDTHAADVRKARAEVARLLAEPATAAPPPLGQALRQLQALRKVRGVAAPVIAAPAPAGTAA